MRTGLAAAQERAALSLSAGAAWALGSYTGAYLTGAGHSLIGHASLGRRRPWRRLTLTSSLGVELRYSFQQLAWRSPATPLALGLASEERRGFGSAGPRASLRLTVGLGRRISLVSTPSFAGLFRHEQGRQTTQLVFHPVVALSVGAGFSL